MSLAHENCPKCGQTLENINAMTIECWNPDCDLETFEDLKQYFRENDITPEDIRR